jgi:hypothetical protein
MPRQTFYEPTGNGYERMVTERLTELARLRSAERVEPEARPETERPAGGAATT